jgi:hypothetical protein
MKNTVGYSGSVTARLSVHNPNGYHFKNNGKKPLWELLSRAVTGKDCSVLTPKSIGIYQDDGEGNYSMLTFTPLPIYGTVYGDVVGENSDNQASVLFTATASYADRKNLANGNVVLRLMSADDTILAEVKDIDSTLKDIHNAMIPGIDAIYEWQLTFRNMPTTDDKEDTSHEVYRK